MAAGSNAVSYMSFVGAVITLVLNINNNINGVSQGVLTLILKEEISVRLTFSSLLGLVVMKSEKNSSMQ